MTRVLLYIGLAALGVVWLFMFARFFKEGWAGLKRQLGFLKRGEVIIIALVMAASFVVARKGPTISFDSLIRDAGSYATNDLLHIAAEKTPAAELIDFDDAPLLVYRRAVDSTNAADWVECLPRRTFGDLPADWVVQNATGYNYMVYLDYVPPSPVHTNGVWEMRGFEVPGHANTYAFPNTRQMALREKKTARDYIQDGLVAMWDGIENAGWGVHDPEAWRSGIVNLVDGGTRLTCTTPSHLVIGDDNFMVRQDSTATLSNSRCFSPTVYEAVVDVPEGNFYGKNLHVASSQPAGVYLLMRLSMRPEARGDDRVFMPLNYYGGQGSCVVGRGRRSLHLRNNFGRVDGVNTRVTFTPNNDISYVYNYAARTSVISGNGGGDSGRGIKMYCLRFYNRALTEAEIQHNYEVDKKRFNLQPLDVQTLNLRSFNLQQSSPDIPTFDLETFDLETFDLPATNDYQSTTIN